MTCSGQLLYAVQEGYKTLEQTPEMLPVLKEAGVVDAGGQGLLFFLEGMIDGIASGADVDFEAYKANITVSEERTSFKEAIPLEFHYCTELLIKGSELVTDDIIAHLAPLGDSMLVVGGEDLIKVHIHSNHPGKVLETALQYGTISDIKINNMAEEVHEQSQLLAEIAEKAENEKASAAQIRDRIGVVAVAAGEGVADILNSLGVEEVVQGGQTMNPSAEDLLRACKRLPTSKVIILPNNSNIILTAEQVTHLCEEKEIRVLPTKSVMQALSAMIPFEPDADIDSMMAEMKEEMRRVQYGEITFAVRDTVINGLEISEGDILGLVNGNICCTAGSYDEALDMILDKMMNDDAEIVTLLYGDGVTSEMAEVAWKRLTERYPACEIELHYGGQAYYAYLVSVE